MEEVEEDTLYQVPGERGQLGTGRELVRNWLVLGCQLASFQLGAAVLSV